mmetsp:Transcript_74380/g.197878  ORF Transcript_74380/g.197878 Transcript_74380/m.197878 type:complete len:210 (-) Transcript_74380:144-773(-)|eukprot:1887856-Prymnesium_polylepis.1
MAAASRSGAGEAREMSFEEKQALSEGINRLTSKNLHKLVKIIHENMPWLGADSDEIQLDLATLDNNTLWKLQHFLDRCAATSRKRSRQEEMPADRGQTLKHASQPQPPAGELFVVEALLAEKKVRGQVQFRVRWMGYGPEEDTWEPESSMAHCVNLIDKVRGKFWTQCDICDKWRRLLPIDRIPAEGEHWICSMSRNAKYNMCELPEEV